MTKDDVWLLLTLGVGALLAALATAALAIALAAPASAQTVIAKTPCAMGEAQFLKGKKALMATPKARDAVIAEINKHRPTDPLTADRMAIAPLGGSEQPMIGVVMFKDKCVLPGTVKAFPLNAWMAFIGSIGLSMDDFVREVDI
jgi:hypothetical protein